MADASNSFSAAVTKWVKQSDARMLAVAKESLQRVVTKAQLRIPVDTGFARASVRASLQGMPPINPTMTKPRKGRGFAYDAGAIGTTIALARSGDRIFVGWTAAYVIYLEYGHSKQAPSGFVRLSAAEWPAIVRQVSAELKNQVISG